MKVSVSLPVRDVEFLDTYAREQHAASRSAALHRAIELLRASQLSTDYENAFDEWAASDEAEVWEAVTADGLAER
jgi:Arc/MetJ-type ribon-helix-helix transcriptional regulator